MGTYIGNGVFDADVYILETTDPVLGGETGELNKAAKNLANRTEYLRINRIAEIAMFGMPTAPDGWLNCEGQSLDRAGIYADLFSLIGLRFCKIITLANNATDIFTSPLHGFVTGDSVNIQNFWSDNVGFQVEISGVQIEVIDNVFIRRIDDNNFTLHPTAIDATNNTNLIDVVVFDAFNNSVVVEFSNKFTLPNFDASAATGGFGDAFRIGITTDFYGSAADRKTIFLNFCIKFR
jgi:hypothetical protein